MTCPHLARARPIRFGLIVEGICPTCELPLERREADGWCYCCEHGWAISIDEVTLTVDPRPKRTDPLLCDNCGKTMAEHDALAHCWGPESKTFTSGAGELIDGGEGRG
jgi:hypothetical protein